MDVLYYVTKAGRNVVDEWISGLGDDRTEARILARIERLSSGNFGDRKPLGGGCLSCASMLGRAIESIAR
jgi:putative component of toxin-antitoxin plasmid stabilization module